MRCPSGLNATLDTPSVWPVSGCADGLAGGRVPQPHRVVGAAGDDALAVGAERHAGHRVRVAGQRLADGLAGVGVPHPHGVVGSCRRRCACPSGLNATLHTASGVAGQRLADRLAGVGVPQPHRVVGTAGDDALAVGAERHAGHRARCGRSAAGRWVGRCPRPTAAPCCRRCRRRCGAVGAERHADHRVGVAGQRLRRSVGRCRRPTAARCCRRLPETMRWPSGLNATLNTASRVAGQRLRRSVGRWPRPTAAPCCRDCRRRCACRRG